MKSLSLVVCLLAACGGGNNGGNNGDDTNDTPDAKVFMDAPVVAPSMFTISGDVTEQGISGESPVSGVSIALYSNAAQQTPIAMATSDAQGKYTMTVMTNGTAIDGFVLAKKSGYVDLYLYPTAPFSKDTDGDLNMLTPSNRDFLSNLASGNQMSGKGLIGLAIIDANGMPVAGATISAMPAAGAYRYMGSNGYPSGSAMSTNTDGVAFMFNVPSGPITISATKAGMTFHSHVVEARADKMTTTAIAP
ncbi:MAG TPA: carboxypeptidase-like regulatory domain-containing protein [Kofleriaceae bacterium]|nr:carboxypeptidase-like regulatory domain-containing protein [Kofleriaceae bacterium]